MVHTSIQYLTDMVPQAFILPPYVTRSFYILTHTTHTHSVSRTLTHTIHILSHTHTTYTLTPSQPKMNGPVDYPDLLPLADGRFTPREEEEEEQEDEEEDEVRSLAGLSPSDTKYQTVTVRCNEQGHFGFTLRHFSIQPSNIPVSVA